MTIDVENMYRFEWHNGIQHLTCPVNYNGEVLYLRVRHFIELSVKMNRASANCYSEERARNVLRNDKYFRYDEEFIHDVVTAIREYEDYRCFGNHMLI